MDLVKQNYSKELLSNKELLEEALKDGEKNLKLFLMAKRVYKISTKKNNEKIGAVYLT